MPFSDRVKEQALVSSGRHCCVCHKFCGIKLELHHIVLGSEGGADTYDNCIPLCFDCHADMKSYDHKHPKGLKYTANELKIHRDKWYQKISRTSLFNLSIETVPADIITYSWIIEKLPWDGPMKWLRDTDLAGSIWKGHFGYFRVFLDGVDNPNREFFDADLEGLRATFVLQLNKMMDLISLNIFHVEGKDNVMQLAAFWRHDDEERFAKLMQSVHSSADLVVQAYRNLVREAELRLRGSMAAM